jgi:membrane protein DedA with SNARE-associated domain
MNEFFSSIIAWYMDHINYWTVTLLMTIESSFIPLPSEIVIPPAAWKAAEGDLNIYLVVICGSVGAVFGALINYTLSITLGRKIIYAMARTKLASLMFINEGSVKKAEDYFNKNGRISTLLGRLVPAVRHLISIPAGLSRMNLKDFLLFTFIGATIWNITLAALGYFLYQQKDLLDRYFHEASAVFLALGIIFVLYLVYKGWKYAKTRKNKV